MVGFPSGIWSSNCGHSQRFQGKFDLDHAQNMTRNLNNIFSEKYVELPSGNSRDERLPSIHRYGGFLEDQTES